MRLWCYPQINVFDMISTVLLFGQYVYICKIN